MLAATLHLGQQFDNFSAQGRCVIDSKFAISIAQNAMGGRLFKIVFQDQAIGSHLDNMVIIGGAGILHTKLELYRNGTTVRYLDDIVRLAH